MEQPLFVNMPDAHLSWGTWADYPGLYGDSFFAFSQGVELCLKHHCGLMLPGDVLDRNTQDDGSVIAFLARQLGRLQAAGLPVWYITGQHERTRRMAWLSSLMLPNVRHVNEVSFRPKNGPLFYGLDFQPAGKLQPALERIPEGTEVLVCHQVWKELMGIEGRPEGEIAKVPHVRVVITGDFHGHKTKEVTTEDGRRVLVISSGSTHMRSLNEDPHKYLHLVGQDLSVESVPLRTRPYLHSRVLTDSQFAAFLEAMARLSPEPTLPDELARPIVHLEYPATMAGVRQKALAAIGTRGFLFDRVLTSHNQTEEEEDTSDLLATIDGGLEGCLDQETAPGMPIHDTCLRLLKVQPSTLRYEIAAIAEERLAGELPVEDWTTS
jgi:hypothetical protein